MLAHSKTPPVLLCSYNPALPSRASHSLPSGGYPFANAVKEHYPRVSYLSKNSPEKSHSQYRYSITCVSQVISRCSAPMHMQNRSVSVTAKILHAQMRRSLKYWLYPSEVANSDPRHHRPDGPAELLTLAAWAWLPPSNQGSVAPNSIFHTLPVDRSWSMMSLWPRKVNRYSFNAEVDGCYSLHSHAKTQVVVQMIQPLNSIRIVSETNKLDTNLVPPIFTEFFYEPLNWGRQVGD